MIVAIFDVDRTLVDGMCGYFFYMAVRPHLSFARRLLISLEMLGHRWGVFDERRVVELGVRMYAGMEVEFLKRLGRRCFEEVIKDRLFVEGLERIERHKASGHRIILVSGSTEFAIAPIAEFVGADEFHATGAFSQNGVSTGKVRYPLNYGEGRLEILGKRLHELGASWDDCYLYSDNLTDISVFERCGHPVVVNPKDALERIARQRRWSIERWTTLRGTGKRASGTSFPLR